MTFSPDFGPKMVAVACPRGLAIYQAMKEDGAVPAEAMITLISALGACLADMGGPPITPKDMALVPGLLASFAEMHREDEGSD